MPNGKRKKTLEELWKELEVGAVAPTPADLGVSARATPTTPYTQPSLLEDVLREKAKQAGESYYWLESEKAWKRVEEPITPPRGRGRRVEEEVPLSRMPFSRQIDPLGEVTPFKQIRGVMTSPEAETVKGVLGFIGLVGTVGLIGWQGVGAIRSLTELRRLPQYKQIVDYAKANNIPRNSKVFKDAEASLRQAINLKRRGANEAANEVMARFNASYTKATPLTRIAPSAPVLVPRGTQTGAMAMGGKDAAIPKAPVVEPIDALKVKLNQAVIDLKPARRIVEKAMSAERAKRGRALAAAQKKYAGEEALIRGKAALRGELVAPVKEVPTLGLSKAETDALYDYAKTFGKGRLYEPLHYQEAVAALLKGLPQGKIPTVGELTRLEEMFGAELIRAIMIKRSLGAKILDGTLQLIGTHKTLRAFLDFSASLRQGITASLAHPEMGIRALGHNVRSFFSEAHALEIEAEHTAHPLYGEHLVDRMGIDFTPLAQRGLAKGIAGREEMFPAQWAYKVPVLKHLIKASENAFVSCLNSLRFDQGIFFTGKWLRGGKQIKDIPDAEWAALGDWINTSLGRGAPQALKDVPHLLEIANAFFFSPQFILGRVRTPTFLLSRFPSVRKIAARDLAAFIGAGLTVMGTYKAIGLATEQDVEFEWNPLSTDFGKIRIGNTRINYWGGFQPYVRFSAQFILGRRKTSTGRITKENRMALLQRFVRTKLSPTVGTLYDILSGTTFLGEELPSDIESLGDYLVNNLSFLFGQDMKEAIEEEGLMGAFLALPGVLGVDVQSYDSSVAVVGDVFSVLSEYEEMQTKVRGWAEKRQFNKITAYAKKHPEARFAFDSNTGQYYSATYREITRVGRQLSELRQQREAIEALGLPEEAEARQVDAINQYTIRVATNALLWLDTLEYKAQLKK